MPPTAESSSTLILDRAEVAALATPQDYLQAVEQAFAGLAQATMRAAAVAHVPGIGGGFHIKSASGSGPDRVVVKINGNFPDNPARHGLPTIQGCLLLADAADGRLLALMDSIEITARRTAATSALAARHLARPDARTLALVGAGVQSHYHVEALLALPGFRFERLRCVDTDPQRAARLCQFARRLGLEAEVVDTPAAACRDADVVVTCTPSRTPLLQAQDVAPGCFIAAVGADHAEKHEIAPALMRLARVVTDLTTQAAAIGDLHHAIAAGAMRLEDVRAELAEVVAGRVEVAPARDDVVVFDSTGIAVTDLAAACMLHARALQAGLPARRGFNAAPAE